MGLLKKFLRRPSSFPQEWDEILAADFAPLKRLPQRDRVRLRELIGAFLREKSFEGCNGQKVDDRVRLVIAAYACLLLLRRPGPIYPALGSVLVYPTSFAAQVSDIDETGVVTDLIEERLGESWQHGTIVLAWDSVEELLKGCSGGLNVIVHEFAHQLDSETGLSEGAPLLLKRDDCSDWHGLCQAEYSRARHAHRRGRPLALDPYAFESPAECFAVASEAFFERPVRLQAHHAELYRELQALYDQDPLCWRLARAGPFSPDE